MRKDVKKYKENPFLNDTVELATLGTRKVCSQADRDLIILQKDTGEFKDLAGFWHKQEVDKTQFVKVYAEGLSVILGLKAPGRKVFSLIYNKLIERPGQSEILLTIEMTDERLLKELKIGRTTFFNGINECLKANIIAASMAAGYYFVNPAYIYNGNRIGIIKEFVLKDTKEQQIHFIKSQKEQEQIPLL